MTLCITGMIATATRPTALMITHDSSEKPHTSTHTHTLQYGTLVWLLLSLMCLNWFRNAPFTWFTLVPTADYNTSLIVAGIDSLRDRREKLTARFFVRQVLASSSHLHCMLPDRHENDTINRLQNPKPFHSIRIRTNRFRKSFLAYCLDNYT